jgi:para-nitrobenzyl esterase
MKHATTLLVASLFQLAASHATASDMLKPVRVEKGFIEGAPVPGKDVVAFKGIPYAAPPVGDLRWREPQPAIAWDGVRKATNFGATCTQPKSGTAETLPWCLRDARDAQPKSYSEDCLFVNVWTPAKTSADKLAVLVYINQGAFHGEGLAQKGILVVTMNYRWGILGGMAHPELTKESPQHLSGNYTLHDIIAALRWVHSNIAAFGGDPDKVTIAGYSVGSTIVHHLTTSPVAKGLFRSAICMSFPYDYLLAPHRVGNVWQKEQEGLKFMAAKKASTPAELRKISAEELVAPDSAVSTRTISILGGAFCRDDWALTLEYPVALERGLESDVPTLTGLTADDAPGLPPVQYSKSTVASFATELPKVFGERRDAFVTNQPVYAAFCSVTTDAEARAMLKRAQLEYRMSTVFSWAVKRSAKARTPVYTYIFNQALPSKEHPEFGAFHTSDLVYEFNNLETVDAPWTDDDRRVADQVSSYWVNFVKTGNPNGENLPRWAPFRADNPATMALGTNSGPREIAGKERLNFCRELLDK